MKLKRLFKILLIILVMAFSAIFGQGLNAMSYNYNDNLEPEMSPYAYNLGTVIDIKENLPKKYQNLELAFTELAFSQDEVFAIGECTRSTDNGRGVLVIMDKFFRFKKLIQNSKSLPIPKNPKTICYTEGKLYIASGEDKKIFKEDLKNPLTKDIIASEYDILDKELKEKINEVKNELSKEEKESFEHEIKDLIRIERDIYIYDRYEDSKKLPDTEIIKYNSKFGLKTKEAKVLKSAFRPIKIASNDKSSNIYVISESSVLGLLTFKKDGTFIKFVGSNKVELSLSDKFWRRFISDEILDEKSKTTQNNFSSLAVDDSGFIYTATETSKNNQVQKFNAKGKNILLENPSIPVKGDFYKKEAGDVGRSVLKFIDVSDFGTYIVFCRSKNRIFSYNITGELLFIEGELGDSRMQFSNVKDMKFFGEDIILLENKNNVSKIKVLKPTKYGKLLNEASKNFYLGKYNESAKIYEDIIKLNSNCNFAYVGRGKIYMIEKDYENACKYFKEANHGKFYAKAYQKLRNKKIADMFILIVAIIVLIISLLVSRKVFFKKDGKKQKRKN